MNKLMKCLFLFITLFLVGNNVVYAELSDHVIDFTKKGKLEVTLKDSDETNSIVGAEISLYYVASVSTDGNKLVYNYTNDFTNCSGDLSDLTNEGLTSAIKQCVTEDVQAVQSGITNDEGVVVFNDLELGLYLVKQTNKVTGYSEIDPFLIKLPKEVENKWTYEISAEPKVDIYQVVDIIVNKVWNSNGSKIPEKVDIELYRGNELIDTIILNEGNNWTYTWKELKKSDNYSVKEINIPKDYTVSYKVNDYTFTVTNTDTLANTGQMFYSIIILFVLGSLLVLIGFKLMGKDA